MRFVGRDHVISHKAERRVGYGVGQAWHLSLDSPENLIYEGKILYPQILALESPQSHF